MLTLMDEAIAAFGKGCLPETLKETLLNVVYITSIRRSLLSASDIQNGRVCTGRLPLIQAFSLESSSSRNGTIGYDLGFACLTCTKERKEQEDKKQVLVCLSCAQKCHAGHFMLPLGYEPEFICHCNLLTDQCICYDDQMLGNEQQDYALWTSSFKHQLENPVSGSHMFQMSMHVR